jgi:hypothetical protein
MQVSDLLARMGGLQSIARELGVSETQAASGAAALAPAILGGFKKQAELQPSGLEGLGSLLGKLGGGELLDDVLAPQPTNVNRGNDVLGQIFGSKDVSRTVAQSAAANTGLSPDLLKKMLPMVAMLVTGYMAKQNAAGAAPAASDASTGARAAPSSGLRGMLSGLFGQGAAGAQRAGATSGLASMLDADGNGNALDDIMRTAGKAMR